jgi:hypothetical protein
MKSLISLLVIALLWLACALGCSLDKTRQTNLPHGNNVEYKHGSKILTQRFYDRDEIHYYQSELIVRPDLMVNGKIVKGHSFDIGSEADGKISARPPKIVTLDLIHDTPSKSSWHFPAPGPQPDLSTRNSTVQVAFIADGQRYELQKGAQIELKKDDPSDATYYEVFITEIPMDTFQKIVNAKEVQLQMSAASFTLDAETLAALHDYGEIISDTK